MAKSKEQKTGLIDSLTQNLNQKRSAFLVDYQGLKVKEIQEMRRKLRDQNISFAVVKNSLFKIALTKEDMEIEPELLDKPLAISFGDDEVALAKELSAAAKQYEAMGMLGGYIDKKFVGEDVVKQLSLLPGREELYAKLVGSINSPISGFVNVMAGNIRNFINVLNNYKESLS
jgi:large subunit ribosomal protein L10